MWKPITRAEQLLWAAVNKMANMQRSDTTRLDDLGALDAIDRNFDELRQTARRAVEQVAELHKLEWPKGQLEVVVIDSEGNKHSCRYVTSALELQLWHEGAVDHETQKLVDMFSQVLTQLQNERRKRQDGTNKRPSAGCHTSPGQ